MKVTTIGIDLAKNVLQTERRHPPDDQARTFYGIRCQPDLLRYRADRLNHHPCRYTLIAKIERLLVQHALILAS